MKKKGNKIVVAKYYFGLVLRLGVAIVFLAYVAFTVAECINRRSASPSLITTASILFVIAVLLLVMPTQALVVKSGYLYVRGIITRKKIRLVDVMGIRLNDNPNDTDFWYGSRYRYYFPGFYINRLVEKTQGVCGMRIAFRIRGAVDSVVIDGVKNAGGAKSDLETLVAAAKEKAGVKE